MSPEKTKQPRNKATVLGKVWGGVLSADREGEEAGVNISQLANVQIAH